MNKTREIRFRAWNKTTPEMIPDFHILSRRMVLFIAQYSNDLKDYCLMQNTGLKDKNGKEIYEGDVLGNRDDASILVWWDDEYACWAAKDPIGGENFGLLKNAFEDASAPYEVIGNIYENPWLITGEANG